MMGEATESKKEELMFHVKRDARLHQLELPDKALLLFDNLLSRANPEKKWSCFPTYAQMVEDLGASESTHKRNVKRLAKAELITVHRRTNTSNLYFIQVEVLREMARVNRLADEEEAPAGKQTTTPIADDDNLDDLDDGNDVQTDNYFRYGYGERQAVHG